MPPLETIDPRILGQRIAEARKARGKTQEEVADFLEWASVGEGRGGRPPRFWSPPAAADAPARPAALRIVPA